MAQVLSLDHVGLVVLDLPAALRFFGDVLGLATLQRWRSPESGLEAVMLDAGRGALELLCFDRQFAPQTHADPFRQPGLRHLTLTVDALDEMHRRLETAGFPILIPPRAGNYFKRFMFVQGPEGILLEMVEA